MKSFWIWLIILIAGDSFATNVPNFGNDYPKFQINKDSQLTWNATNHLQENLWTYKIIPQHFPSSVISNLVAMEKFTWQDERNGHQDISDTNEGTLFFYSKARLSNFSVVPAEGKINYLNGQATASHWDKTNHLWEEVDGVPNNDELEKLGLDFIKPFGIQRSDLAQRADGHLITWGDKKTRSYHDRRTNKYIEDEVTARGIYFVRRINGVDFVGIGLRGGCVIEFGNQAKISDFQLNWPNLQPFEQYNVATQSELIGFIQDGNAVMTHMNRINPAEIKSLTITPFYWGTGADEHQTIVYPFAQVNATANLGYTNEDIQLYCPILSTNRLN